MADKKISQLTGATTPLAGTEVLPIVQSGSTVKVSVADLTAGRTVDASTVNATTVDATNVEVTNVKAKDGTAAVTIADSTGAVTVSSGSILNGGVVVNETSADADFRVESDTNEHALFVDAGVSKVGIGTSTFNTNGGVLQVSNGISFPATQSACSDANTLDDYEEGTWTPTYYGASSAGTTTYVTQTGNYTKVGRQVTAICQLSISAATGTGEVRIGGLPFNAAIRGFTAASLSNLDFSGGTYVMIWNRNAEAVMEAIYVGDDIPNGNQLVTNESQTWAFVITYFV